MYSDSIFILLILGGAALLILLIGLVLSILVFRTKSRAMEIIAWVCGGCWLVLDQLIIYSGDLGINGTSNYFIYPVFLIFFLLLQYRSNTAEGNNLKTLYIAKSVMILLVLSTLHSQVINMFLERRYIDYADSRFTRIIPIAGSIVSIAVITFVTFRYLVRTHASVQKNEVFKNAIVFTGITYLIADVISHLLFLLQYARHVPVGSFFNVTMLSMQLIYFLVESLLAAGIAALIYKSKQEAGPAQIKD